MKMTLKQLVELFAQSAVNTENPQSIRQFAAQLTILTAHVERVEIETRKALKTFDASIAELAQYVLKVRDGAPAPSAPAVQPPQAQSQTAQAPQSEPEDDDIDAMIEKVRQDTEADLVASMKPPKVNGSTFNPGDHIPVSTS